ncbi:MAG: hypothetical protein KDJ35_03370 [Alphaproteobacteria bacterium]|nr:hypothetical protein [Alphaproteobacteria bacterium]
MDYQWLQLQFEHNPDKSKAGLAHALGLEPPAISKILKGNRQIKAHEYVKMRRYFGLPVDGENAVSSQSVLKPLSQNHQESFLQDKSDTADQENWIIPETVLNRHTSTSTDKIKVFSIKETVMEPDFKNGEHVLVDLSDTLPSPPGVYIISDGYSYMARHCEIITGSKPPQIKISARDENFNQHTISLDDCKIIGRVIAKLQWL